MPYDFWIKEGPFGPIRATLTDDGELVFEDYDIRADMSGEAIGMGTSKALMALYEWENDPVRVLCGGRPLLPLKDNAIAAWAWARLMVDSIGLSEGDITTDEKVRQIKKLLNVTLTTSFEALINDLSPLKGVVKARKDIANAIAQCDSFHLGREVDGRTIDKMEAVKTFLDGVVTAASYKNMLRKLVVQYSDREAVHNFCLVAGSAYDIISPGEDPTDELVEAAIEVLGKVQKAEGGLSQ